MAERSVELREDGQEEGSWCSIAEAGRRYGLSRRAIRDRLDRGRLTARANNAGRREVWVPASAVPPPRPVDGQADATGRPMATASVTMAAGDPAILAPAAVERERERREAVERELGEVRVGLARAEAEVAALREALADQRERERERVAELRAALTAAEQALAEARRPWLARWLDALRSRRALTQK
jgi:hypothetical protein